MKKYGKQLKEYDKIGFDTKAILSGMKRLQGARRKPTSTALEEDLIKELKKMAAKKGGALSSSHAPFNCGRAQAPQSCLNFHHPSSPFSFCLPEQKGGVEMTWKNCRTKTKEAERCLGKTNHLFSMAFINIEPLCSQPLLAGNTPLFLNRICKQIV